MAYHPPFQIQLQLNFKISSKLKQALNNQIHLKDSFLAPNAQTNTAQNVMKLILINVGDAFLIIIST